MQRELSHITIESFVDKYGRLQKKFKFSEEALQIYFRGEDPYPQMRPTITVMGHLSHKHGFQDLISAMSNHIEIAVNLGVYLGPNDLISLYMAHPAFRKIIDSNLFSSIKTWIEAKAPEAGRIFPYKIYRNYLVEDPAGRTWAELWGMQDSKVLSAEMIKTRTIPGIKYAHLVIRRDQHVRQILALMARSGHRMPKTMHATVLRLWLLMDIPASGQRMAILRNEEFWTDEHLYNAMFFFVKLSMLFSDPVYGPTTPELLILMLGQKGLYPLWQLLFRKKWTRISEVANLAVRYNFVVPPDHWGEDYFNGTIHGVPFNEVGRYHLEGWGKGTKHLMRPDELIPLEAVRRGLELDQHLIHMVTWGFFD